ncbi:MAG: hypothetical protein FWE53_02595 [Firmicutes bacterium]|nr:hypothetical protein [Bacillota bacterium]
MAKLNLDDILTEERKQAYLKDFVGKGIQKIDAVVQRISAIHPDADVTLIIASKIEKPKLYTGHLIVDGQDVSPRAKKGFSPTGTMLSVISGQELASEKPGQLRKASLIDENTAIMAIASQDAAGIRLEYYNPHIQRQLEEGTKVAGMLQSIFQPAVFLEYMRKQNLIENGKAAKEVMGRPVGAKDSADMDGGKFRQHIRDQGKAEGLKTPGVEISTYTTTKLGDKSSLTSSTHLPKR